MTERTTRRTPRAAVQQVATDTSPTTIAHAQAAKVLTTGVSLSMVLGIVAYMAVALAEARVLHYLPRAQHYTV